MILLAIDPDVEACGFAWFEDGVLLSAVREPKETLRQRPRPDRVVIEGQQIYTDSKVPPASIIKVAHVAGYLSGVVSLWGDVQCYVMGSPKEWTKTPKKINQLRIWKTLSAEERRRVTLPKNKSHASEILDAIGIGLWDLKRTGQPTIFRGGEK